MDLWVIGIWVLLVILAIPEFKKIPERLRSLRRGIKGLVIVPVSAALLFAVAYGALILSENVPILKWGWLGANIAAAPLADVGSAAATAAASGVALDPILYVEFLVFVSGLIALCLVSNYYEEELFRGSFKSVVVWALLHLVMGIPIFAVIPIFSVGLVYKAIHDKWGLDHAYCVHFFTNMTLVAALIVAFIFMV